MRPSAATFISDIEANYTDAAVALAKFNDNPSIRCEISPRVYVYPLLEFFFNRHAHRGLVRAISESPRCPADARAGLLLGTEPGIRI